MTQPTSHPPAGLPMETRPAPAMPVRARMRGRIAVAGSEIGNPWGLPGNDAYSQARPSGRSHRHPHASHPAARNPPAARMKGNPMSHPRLPFAPAAAALAALLAALAPSPRAQAADPVFTVGPRLTVLGDKAGGLSMFPEAPITILKTTPQFEVLIPAAMKTAYCKGPSMDKLTATGFALSPSMGRSYDRVSAHITSTWKDPASGDLYAVFSANDSDEVPRIPGPGIGYRGRYYTAALAKSTNGGASFEKLGAILSVPKNASASAMQGNAFGAVVMSPDKQWLYLYYGDMYMGMLYGGIQTSVARAPVASKGMPGSWMKWFAGDWQVPGLSTIDSASGSGAESSPVIANHVSLFGDAMHPHVSWSDKLGAYVMTYVINVPDETPGPDSLGKYPPVEYSGIYIAFSRDGLTWGGRTQLVKAIAIDYPGREVAMHPSLIVDEAGSTATSLKATLYYGYSANMWLGTPATQYLVSNTVQVTGLTADQMPSALAPQPRLRDRAARGIAPAHTLRRAGPAAYHLRFADPAARPQRILRLDGTLAATPRPLAGGDYALDLPNFAGPLFLQGMREGKPFAGLLGIP